MLQISLVLLVFHILYKFELSSWPYTVDCVALYITMSSICYKGYVRCQERQGVLGLKMNKRYPIRFSFTSDSGVIVLGFLYWPWKVHETVNHGDLWEIVDARGVSVISLEDIRLSDLWPEDQ